MMKCYKQLVIMLEMLSSQLIGMVTGKRGSDTMNSRTLALNADEARPLMKKYVRILCLK